MLAFKIDVGKGKQIPPRTLTVGSRSGALYIHDGQTAHSCGVGRAVAELYGGAPVDDLLRRGGGSVDEKQGMPHCVAEWDALDQPVRCVRYATQRRVVTALRHNIIYTVFLQCSLENIFRALLARETSAANGPTDAAFSP